jgi:hypothetical protein
MSLMGLVSRVTPVHTAVRNCTRDEGRSFEVGNQVLISSHRKSSKAMNPQRLPSSKGHLLDHLVGDSEQVGGRLVREGVVPDGVVLRPAQ